MLRKIFFECGPGARHDPLAGVDPGDALRAPPEDVARERKRHDIAAGRTPPSLEVNSRRLAPNQNPGVRRGMLQEKSSRLLRRALRGHPEPRRAGKADNPKPHPTVGSF